PCGNDRKKCKDGKQIFAGNDRKKRQGVDDKGAFAETTAFPKRRLLWSGREGQSLIEVAIFVPIFTLLICYSVDFGYCFLAAATIDAASQNAIDYAIQGTKSPAQASAPSGSSVAALATAALGLPNASSFTSVQVCNNSVGTPQNNIAQCQTFGADTSLSYAADTDPESPIFQLNRVDVVYTVSPPIPLPASILPSLTFHRFVEMRAIQ
ncbi:MAG: TadE/TadG family type IV pilus assembly protein, partial [Gemmataceae bacterium]